jgi:hypothetical protein
MVGWSYELIPFTFAKTLYMKAAAYHRIFDQVLADYHRTDSVDAQENNPFEVNSETLSFFLYHKCWIDNIQWHLEDIIRDPNIEPEEALNIKRRIDAKNQERTDCVEDIDTYFFKRFKDIQILEDARWATETPAWAIDRLSILALKIYHMREETERTNASEEHIMSCQQKLDILLQQRADLTQSIEWLLEDLSSGKLVMKTYKQMKMYNDPSLNPVLYRDSE